MLFDSFVAHKLRMTNEFIPSGAYIAPRESLTQLEGHKKVSFEICKININVQATDICCKSMNVK